MEPIVFVLLFFIIMGIAFISSMVGIGGGTFLVPILILGFGFPPAEAAGTSSMYIWINAISATYAYHRRGKVLFKPGLILELMTVPGALVGAYLTVIIPEEGLKILLASVLTLTAIRMLSSKRSSNENKNSPGNFMNGLDKVKLIVALIGAFLAGILSGALGIGGGTIKVPILYFLLGVPMDYAAATSTFMILLTSFSASIEHIMLGHVDFVIVASIIPGAIIGSQLGPRVALSIRKDRLKQVFGIILLFVVCLLML